MSVDCCHHEDQGRRVGSYRRLLWVVLGLNVTMFAVEIGAGLAAGSASLQADALDFLGDAANYAISLLVVGMALRYRATAALAKGATMGLLGLWVVAVAAWRAMHGTMPEPVTMGANVSASASAFVGGEDMRDRRALCSQPQNRPSEQAGLGRDVEDSSPLPSLPAPYRLLGF
jgi:Co/Zn/Cd efflux system component